MSKQARDKHAMRLGMPISAVGHAGVLLWTLISFGGAQSLDTPEQPMPVDIVSIKEFSQAMAGAQSAPQADKPKPVVDKVGDPKPVEDPTVKVSQRPPVEATESAPPPPSDPSPPEPKPPEQKDTKPTEPTVDPVAEALKKEEAEKKLEEQRQLEQKKLEEQKRAEEQKKREEARKRAEAKRIEDAKKREEAKKNEEKIAQLLNQTDPRREAATGAVPNQTPNLGAPQGTASTLSQTELDAMRARLMSNWHVDEAILERPEKYVVLVRIKLGRDRMLSAPPQIVSAGSDTLGKATAEAAVRSILNSQPFDMLSQTTYDQWSDLEINFDPNEKKH
jgi:hypothetical protein